MKSLQIYKEKAKHHSKAFEYFSFDKLDAFHNQEILSVIYGEKWYSVLITEKEKAILHTFSKQRIGDTGWYDVEPFIGYAGPITNTTDKSFINKALEMYSALCKEEKIIAEIIRFNCILCNHTNFENDTLIRVSPAKEIIVVECFKDETLQLKQFSKKSCRYMIQKYRGQYQFKSLYKTKDWEKFLNLYMHSIKRVGADKKWRFSVDFFGRARKSEHFIVYTVWHENKLVSTSLVIEHPLAAYYFLAGNSDDLMPGSGELLIFGIAQAVANKNITSLILGGGNSPALDDPLLQFKRKFTKTTQTFFIGKIIHNPEIFQEFCNDAIRANPEIEKSNFFLKYRLLM